MKLKLAALLCATIFLQTAHAQTPEWVSIGQASNNSSWYVRSTMEKKDQTGIQVWVKEVGVQFTYNNLTYDNGTIRVLMIAHCGGRKVMSIRTMWFDQNGNLVKDGGQIYPRQNMWQPVVPDTMEQLVLDKACELFN